MASNATLAVSKVWSQHMLIFLFAICCSVSSALAIAALPSPDICGWPSLREGGRFGPSTVRLAQRLLSHVLTKPISIDGIFSLELISDIKEFQEMHSLNTTGVLNADSWPTLISLCTPLDQGQTGILVQALQDSLTFNGFQTNVTGYFDENTAKQLKAFTSSRSLNTSSSVVDFETWHFLATGCNSSKNAAFWIDVGWPQGSVTDEQLQCLRNVGFSFVTFECWLEEKEGIFWDPCISNIFRAQAAGFSVGVYMFPWRPADASVQVSQLLGNLSAAGVKGVKQIMLDIEGPTWNFTQSENRDYVLALRSAVERGGLNVTVYCTNWPETFGPDFTAFKDVPLIYAHYDLVPSYYDYIEHPFGGWVVCFTPACVDVALHRIAATCLTSTCQVPDGKQFWDGAGDVEVCGFTGGDNLDWDWSATPFW